MVAGIGHVRLLPSSADDDYAFDTAALEAAIEDDIAAGLLPFYVVGTVGTTSSCAVDNLAELGLITNHHKLWCVASESFYRIEYWCHSHKMLPKNNPYSRQLLIVVDIGWSSQSTGLESST